MLDTRKKRYRTSKAAIIINQLFSNRFYRKNLTITFFKRI